MKCKLDKMVCNISYPKSLNPLKYFKQFIVYDNIELPIIYYEIDDISVTIPKLELYTTKIVDTKQGTSLEGQYLSGKKLVITGNIISDVVINYVSNNKKVKLSKTKIYNIGMPFSTFIIIPNDSCNKEIELRYLIEDVTAIEIDKDKIFISILVLMQYLN